ncbi:MAG: AlpA family phage regulatory protein [Acinetobacter sp.]|jgi:predicted DNA-binding transcriptional regulator AlpA
MSAIQETDKFKSDLLNKKLYYRMADLATTAERKPRTYTNKSGVTRTIKGRPARQGLLPMGESTIWDKVRSGDFPGPVKLSERITAWCTEDIEAWMASKGLEA